MTSRISLRNERGQSVTEFALVLPILALLLFGVIQFGIVFNHYLSLEDASRAGARKAAVGRHLDDPVGEACGAVRRSARNLTGDLRCAVSSSWEQGESVTVQATYPYRISLLGMVVKSGRLSSTTEERVE